MKYNFDPITEQPLAGDESPEQHHGDLRKGAYLQRRAAYQSEANAPRTAQAGTLGLTIRVAPGLIKGR